MIPALHLNLFPPWSLHHCEKFMIIITAASFTAVTNFADITIATIITVITSSSSSSSSSLSSASSSSSPWLLALVKVKELLLIRSHCRREASPIHWLPYIKSCHPRRAVDKNQKSPGNEVLTMPDSWHWYLGEPVLLVLPKRKESFGMGSSFQVRHDQPKQAPFWILCWHVSMKGRSIIQIQASCRQILSNISPLIRAEYWKSQPRKLCEFCKCWITDNKPVTYKTCLSSAREV